MARHLEDVETRRAARHGWPVARFRLGEEPLDDLSHVTTPAERIAMMWPLALAAWAAARRPVPTYTRSDMPGRFFAPGVPRPDDE
jgi:hypothetical protein